MRHRAAGMLGTALLIIATFLLLLPVFALAVDRCLPASWAGLMIGLPVTAMDPG